MADLVRSGLDEGAARAEAARLTGQGPTGPLHLPQAMRGVIDLAFATRGQWRVVATTQGIWPVALDLTAVDVAARWLGLTPDPGLLADLAVIEAEAMRLMSGER